MLKGHQRLRTAEPSGLSRAPGPPGSAPRPVPRPPGGPALRFPRLCSIHHSHHSHLIRLILWIPMGWGGDVLGSGFTSASSRLSALELQRHGIAGVTKAIGDLGPTHVPNPPSPHKSMPGVSTQREEPKPR